MNLSGEWHSGGDALADKICDEFEKEWQTKQGSQIGPYLEFCPTSERTSLLCKLIAIDVRYRAWNNNLLTQSDYEREFPDLKEAIAMAFESLGGGTEDFLEATADRRRRAPTAGPMPERIDRYEVIKLLGSGGFGAVYAAHDPNLNRKVAIKVPRADLAKRSDYVRDFLLEAETLAKLDHPNVVRVHDARQTEDGGCFLVSEWIQGTDLRGLMTTRRLSWRQAVTLVAKVADALQHAHRLKLVHRDIKPANILIDKSDEPHLADFGLALREEEFGFGGRFAGTPSYMSPEQARGEGHLVDGRSDIYSLGVVLYELLTGERPISATSDPELRERITHLEPRPPRQLRSEIPPALERICLKALSRQAADRYTTALDMAEDLRCCLDEDARSGVSAARRQAVRVIPKGLRSFDQIDADFFLRLLPGPRD